MNKTLGLALAIALAGTGCATLEPRLPEAQPQIPQSWPVPENGITPTAGAVGEVGWRDVLVDPRLERVVAQALENNRDLRVAMLNVERARAQYRIQRAERVPAVGANVAMERTGGDAPTTDSFTASAGLASFELDLFGRLRSLNQQALESYLATEEARNATQIALIAEVANAYLTFLGDRKQLALSEKTLATRQKSYELIERRLELGMSNELDRAQARTAVESARTNQARYIRLVEQDVNALQLLVGAPINRAAPTIELDSVQLVQDMPVGLPSEVLLRRPDIMQAEHALKAANANIGAARAAFFPRVSLTALAGFASPALSSLFDSDNHTWSFAPSITVPIFDAGRNQANLEASKANREIAVARYEKSIQSAFRDVSDGLVARGTLVNQIEAQKALVDAADTSYRLSDARYRHGIDSYLAVLDAERSLYSAQQDLIQVQVQRLSNLVSLYKALGGGRS